MGKVDVNHPGIPSLKRRGIFIVTCGGTPLGVDVMDDSRSSNAKAYWKENIRLVLMLLAVWFVVSYGMGILFVDTLDQFRFMGFRLGFWMAQQGAIYCFVILIFVYAYKMNRLDHKYGVDEDQDDFVPDEDYYHLEEKSDEEDSKK